MTDEEFAMLESMAKMLTRMDEQLVAQSQVLVMLLNEVQRLQGCTLAPMPVPPSRLASPARMDDYAGP